MITVYLTLKPGSSIFQPTFTSDTLFSAIATAGTLLGYSIEKWFDDENLRISNTFPFKKENGSRQHFFLRPALPLKTDAPTSLESYNKIKRFKKLQWIDQNSFIKILQTGNLESYYKTWQKEVEKDKIEYTIKRIIPRNTVNRLSLEVEEGFYTKIEYFFKDGWGLYFMVKASEGILEQVKAAIHLLEDRGIGGDISTGRGAFNVEIKDSPIDFSQITPKRTMILSLYYPRDEEFEYIKSDNSFYKIVSRKGFISVHGVNRVFKKRVVALDSGSVIDAPPEEIIGKKVIVANKKEINLDYDIFLYGRPFTVPMGG